MLEQILPWLNVVIIAVCVILFLYCIVLHTKIAGLRKKYNYFMNGSNGVSIERKLSVEVAELRENAKMIDTLFQQQTEIQKVQNHSFQKIGFIKYNAFENIGNNLSFSLTLLDGQNNGIIISSVYGRNESRFFSKPIIQGKSLSGLSAEEEASLRAALQSTSTQEGLTTVAIRENMR